MKKSRYNMILRKDDSIYLYNLFSQSLLCFSEHSGKIASYLINDPNFISENHEVQSLQELLRSQGFIVEDSFDEIGTLKRRWEYSKNGCDEFGIQLGTTLQCNFRCPYCYESHEQIKLPREKQDSFISFVLENCKNWKKFTINWFGGEPLLEPKIIAYISRNIIEICDRNKVEYSGMIISNGYLLNHSNAALLHECRIRDIQITIDGDRSAHDKRRYLVNGDGSYDTIVKNLLSYGYLFDLIRLRVNIDGQSAEQMAPMIEDLKPLRKNLVFGFLPTQASQGAAEHLTVAYEDNIDRINKIKLLAISEGFKVATDSKNPGQVYCSAYDKNFFSIDARGDVHKCVPMVGKSAFRVGYLSDDGQLILNPDVESKWNFNPFDDQECISCEFLPMCMGGCQNFPLDKKQESGRCSVKDGLDATLASIIGVRGSLVDQL